MGSGKTLAEDGQAIEAETVDEAVDGQAPAKAGVDNEVARLSALVEEYRNESLRARADYDNLRKRTDREKAEFKAYANEGLIKDLIDVYENLERALDAAKKPDAQTPQLVKGLEMVYVQMKVVLRQYGLNPIDTVGKKFDPRTMEAMMQEESEEAEEDTVLEEFQRGYTLSSKVIRCSKVKVSKR
ncbi:MAG: nucleotide exchange factor GrpE [Methanocella sp.]